MAEYFRDVDRPEALLPRERHPRTGRRVPKTRSKGQSAPPGPTRRWPIVAAAAGLAGVAIVVLAARDDGGSSSSHQIETDATSAVAASPVPVTEPATTLVAAATPATTPATTLAITTTPATTVPATAVPAPLRLGMEPLPAAVQVIPADPNATATYSGVPPTFAFVVECVGQTCSFPLTVNLPGTVTPEGFNVVNAVDGHIDLTSSVIDTCTGSQGTVFTREIVSTVALTLSGAQQIGDQLYPQRLAGTLTAIVPEAGLVPHVGDAVDRGAETGCSGQTTIFTVDAPLHPVAS